VKEIVPLASFRADLKRLRLNRIEIESVDYVAQLLSAGIPLPPHLKDHALRDTWAGYRECHFEGDLLLIYRVTPNKVILRRLGTHADLFGKGPGRG
jgi:mRNA interferase YafQ